MDVIFELEYICICICTVRLADFHRYRIQISWWRVRYILDYVIVKHKIKLIINYCAGHAYIEVQIKYLITYNTHIYI